MTRWPCLWRNWKIDNLGVSDITGSETGPHPNDFRNSFSGTFPYILKNILRYISVHSDMQLIFFDLRILVASSVGPNWPTDSRKRTKLNGKVSDLPDSISSILNVPLSNINVDGYVCKERSYRDLKRLEKILEDAKSLQPQSFTTNNRTKRCVPSDSRISPSVSAPSKSLRHAMDQGRTFCFDVIISATIFARRKSAGGNMIGLNQQRKSHASSRSFGGRVWAHFPEQRLVIEPTSSSFL